ncbi:hypothetical protein ACFCZR_24645 [Streptomyces rubiginosohelvolus]|uniref:hypothetical protein n=1 Tax=Streptomyces rubiginosohelvolus TaxID=67362 RepID=UPI0035DCE3CC
MTTQPPSRALAREAAGLLLTAFGALGTLVALGTIHWALGLSAATAGILAAGILITPRPDAPPSRHAVRGGLCVSGAGGLIGCAFAVSSPLGWLGVGLATTALGCWMSTRESDEEPPAEGA